MFLLLFYFTPGSLLTTKSTPFLSCNFSGLSPFSINHSLSVYAHYQSLAFSTCGISVSSSADSFSHNFPLLSGHAVFYPLYLLLFLIRCSYLFAVVRNIVIKRIIIILALLFLVLLCLTLDRTPSLRPYSCVPLVSLL